PTYSGGCAPRLQRRCVRCHTPGEIAPWSMTNYAIVQSYSPTTKDELMAGRMPPWHADPYYGTFANDIAMTREEKAMLLQWIADGSPRGDGPDPLADAFVPQAPDWPLGTPDYIVSIPRQDIPASGVVPYRYLTVISPIPSNVWLRAAVVLPSNRRVVHHSLVFVGVNIPFGGLG